AWLPRPKQLPAVRQVIFKANAEQGEALSGQVQTRELLLAPFGVMFETGWLVQLIAVRHYEAPLADFSVAGAVIPRGSYYFNEYQLLLGSPPSKRLSFKLRR
ncbi:MAG: hypothetical protein L0H83_09590, partial [Salinisphaera sp.]|nr:hypothetical protein [Salinisphaera sp.]